MRNSNPHSAPVDAAGIQSYSGYLYFVYEREIMRVARDNGYTGPLTADPVLSRYRFTNIRRRDDRMSRWFITNLIDPAVEDGDQNLWFTLLVARLINWPPTIQALIDAGVIPCSPASFNADRFVEVLEGQKAKGLKVYGGAYMVYPTMKDPGGVKSQSIARWIIGDVVKRAPQIERVVFDFDHLSVCRIVTELSKCFGVSTFIAGQVAADLSYTPMGGDFTDLYTWAPLGPGSQQGLNQLYGKPKFHTWAQRDFNDALMRALGAIERELDITGMTLHDVQNTFCEYGKYARTVLGEGKPKTNYKPETEY